LAGPERLSAESDEDQPRKVKPKKKAPAKDTDAPEAEKTPLETDGDVISMAEELNLTEEQIEKIQELINKRDEAIQKQQQATSKKIERLEKALAKARSKKRKAKIEAAIKNLRKGEKESEKRLEKSYANRIMTLLKQEQRAQWNAAKLQEAMLEEFSSLTLEVEQHDKIKALCTEAAKRITAPVDVRYNPSARISAARQIYRRVLSKKQQKQYSQEKTRQRPVEKEGKSKKQKKTKSKRSRTNT
jgi:hypothetical protein